MDELGTIILEPYDRQVIKRLTTPFAKTRDCDAEERGTNLRNNCLMVSCSEVHFTRYKIENY
uniref:Uncharacterized protein n=1 Tax=Romanomermis culicivorax TaxID=13658 RepID=A0A915KEC8_ROMCU